MQLSLSAVLCCAKPGCAASGLSLPACLQGTAKFSFMWSLCSFVLLKLQTAVNPAFEAVSFLHGLPKWFIPGFICWVSIVGVGLSHNKGQHPPDFCTWFVHVGERCRIPCANMLSVSFSLVMSVGNVGRAVEYCYYAVTSILIMRQVASSRC